MKIAKVWGRPQFFLKPEISGGLSDSHTPRLSSIDCAWFPFVVIVATECSRIGSL